MVRVCYLVSSITRVICFLTDAQLKYVCEPVLFYCNANLCYFVSHLLWWMLKIIVIRNIAQMLLQGEKQIPSHFLQSSKYTNKVSNVHLIEA